MWLLRSWLAFGQSTAPNAQTTAPNAQQPSRDSANKTPPLLAAPVAVMLSAGGFDRPVQSIGELLWGEFFLHG